MNPRGKALPVLCLIISFVVLYACSNRTATSVSPPAGTDSAAPSNGDAQSGTAQDGDTTTAGDQTENVCAYTISCNAPDSECGEISIKSPDLSQKMVIPIQLKNNALHWGWLALDIRGFTKGTIVNAYWTDLYEQGIAADPDWYTNNIDSLSTMYGHPGNVGMITTTCSLQLKGMAYYSLDPIEKPVTIADIKLIYAFTTSKP